jgi:hypothetical protein
MNAEEHPVAGPDECDCAAVAVHLTAAFRSVAPDVVHAVVTQAALELQGQVTPGAQAELVHRLAACRLGEMSRHLSSAGSAE